MTEQSPQSPKPSSVAVLLATLTVIGVVSWLLYILYHLINGQITPEGADAVATYIVIGVIGICLTLAGFAASDSQGMFSYMAKLASSIKAFVVKK